MDRASAALFLAILLAVVGAGAYIHYFAYGRTAMVTDIVRAKEFLWRARSSIDLEVQANYMEKSLEELKSRSGNPNWVFGFPDTDFSLIKNDIRSNIDAAREIAQAEPKGSYGYQRAVDNIEEICIELNEHLDIAIDWCTYWLPFNITLNIVCWIAFIICLIILFFD